MRNGKHIKTFVLLSWTCMAVTSCSTAGPADHALEQGRESNSRGNYRDALAQFTTAISLNPKMPEAYSRRGGCYVALGAYQKAIEDFTTAIHLDPTDAINYADRGIGYYNLGQFQKAIDDYSTAIKLDGKYSLAFVRRASAYRSMGQLQNAIDDSAKAIELDPKMAMAYYEKAIAYQELRQFQKTIDNCAKAIELNKNFVNAYVVRANAYNQVGQYQLSLTDCNKAIEMDPKYSYAYSCRAVAQDGLGQGDKAVDDINQAINFAGPAAAAADLITLAVLLDKKGRYAEADALYDKAELQSATHYELKHGSLKGNGKYISVCRARRLLQEIPEEQAVKEFPWSKEYLSDKKRGTLSYVREFAIVPIRLHSVRDFRSGSTGNAILSQDALQETASAADTKLHKRELQKTDAYVRQKVGPTGDATVVQGIQTAGTVITEDTARRYLARLNREQALTNFKWSKDFLSVSKDDGSPPLAGKSPLLVGRGPSSLKNFLSTDGLIITNEDYTKLKKMAHL